VVTTGAHVAVLLLGGLHRKHPLLVRTDRRSLRFVIHSKHSIRLLVWT
jgi:hypothetical protein